MKLIVDTNVIISAILNHSGNIGQILIFSDSLFEFYTPELVRVELKRHKNRLLEYAQISEADFDDIKEQIFDCLHLISEEQIPFRFWIEALPFVRDTDTDDVAFVALSLYMDAYLWTGDKKLLRGLQKAGFDKGLSTEDVIRIRDAGGT